MKIKMALKSHLRYTKNYDQAAKIGFGRNCRSKMQQVEIVSGWEGNG